MIISKPVLIKSNVDKPGLNNKEETKNSDGNHQEDCKPKKLQLQ